MASTAIVAYLVLFATVGFLFLFVSLLLGKFLRAHSPTPLKLETYECGEPAIGPGSVQFDLRFYVVALVFIIFEVEVAMFFPTATVFGKATRLLSPDIQMVEVTEKYRELGVAIGAMPLPDFRPRVSNVVGTLRVPTSQTGKPYQTHTCRHTECADYITACEQLPVGHITSQEVVAQGNTLALASMLDLGVFFAVLLVGFAFVWKRGDLDWVRSVRHPPTPAETAALAKRLRGEA